MNWLEKLERKFGNRGIHNITSYVLVFTLIGAVILYAAAYGNQTAMILYSLIRFSPELILKGQVWRLFTWIFMPIDSLGFLSILFMLCLFMLGRSLEQGLGTFRMTVYFVGGWLLNTVGGMLIYVLFGVPIYLSPYYIIFSLYLMLGIFFPDAEMRLYFVLPIKMKWLVLVYAVMLLYEVFTNFSNGLYAGLQGSSEIIFSIANLLIFVSACKNQLSLRTRRKQVKRQRQYQQQFSGPRPGAKISHHKCAICGRTELDDSTLTFRYCSKCEGNREYCQEHLFTHQHYRTM